MHGFRVASIYRPDTGAVVQLNNLVHDSTQYEKVPIEGSRSEDAHGNAFEGGSNHLFKIRALGATERDTLQVWYDAGVKVRCVALAAAPDGPNVQWYEDVRMQSFKPVTIGGKAEGRSDAFDVVLHSDNPRASIYRQVNLVGHLGWADADANGVADGYVAGGTDAVGLSFASGEQRITQASGVRNVVATIELPIAGVTVTGSVLATALHASATENLNVSAYSFAASSLGGTDAALVASPARSSQAQATPAGTYTIGFAVLRVSGGSGSSMAAVKDAALRADASTVYTPY